MRTQTMMFCSSAQSDFCQTNETELHIGQEDTVRQYNSFTVVN